MLNKKMSIFNYHIMLDRYLLLLYLISSLFRQTRRVRHSKFGNARTRIVIARQST